MSLRDNAVYVGGMRTADPRSLDETFVELVGGRREGQGLEWLRTS